MTLQAFVLLNITWDRMCGFLLEFITVETLTVGDQADVYFSASLFGINYEPKQFLFIDFLFIHFIVFDKTDYTPIVEEPPAKISVQCDICNHEWETEQPASTKIKCPNCGKKTYFETIDNPKV